MKKMVMEMVGGVEEGRVRLSRAPLHLMLIMAAALTQTRHRNEETQQTICSSLNLLFCIISSILPCCTLSHLSSLCSICQSRCAHASSSSVSLSLSLDTQNQLAYMNMQANNTLALPVAPESLHLGGVCGCRGAALHAEGKE